MIKSLILLYAFQTSLQSSFLTVTCKHMCHLSLCTYITEKGEQGAQEGAE